MDQLQSWWSSQATKDAYAVSDKYAQFLIDDRVRWIGPKRRAAVLGADRVIGMAVLANQLGSEGIPGRAWRELEIAEIGTEAEPDA
jgi:hypothetical protein